MRIAIYGYGNLGKGVELALREAKDMTLEGIYTRRSPGSVPSQTGAAVYRAEDILAHQDQIDAVINCGGSATDLPVTTPLLAQHFNVVDSFDTHARIAEHFAAVDAAARKGGHTALISGGWDPGLFSLMRLYAGAVLPNGQEYTFWGRGVSQGHSDAIRRIPGVKDARQYTVPAQAALDRVLRGEQPALTAREKHTRECYVVAEEGADRATIEQAIKTMPHYFDEYDTTVHFISAEELRQNHSGMPHGGTVIRNGSSGLRGEHAQHIDFSLRLDSNPEFTAGVLVALARAAVRLNLRGDTGCKTIFDIAPADLSPLTPEEMRKRLL